MKEKPTCGCPEFMQCKKVRRISKLCYHRDSKDVLSTEVRVLTV